jgi:hypothetical protein
MKNLLPKYML